MPTLFMTLPNAAIYEDPDMLDPDPLIPEDQKKKLFHDPAPKVAPYPARDSLSAVRADVMIHS